MTDVRPSETQARDRARGAIQEFVRDQGPRLSAMAPTAMVASLVAAACAPVVWPLLPNVHDSLKAAVQLFGGVGSAYIGTAIQGRIERLRRRGDRSASPEERQCFEQALVDGLEDDLELRVYVIAVLKAVGGVDAALQEATEEVRSALAEGFAKCSWMLDEARVRLTDIQAEQASQSAEQRQQTGLIRDNLILTSFLVQLLNGPLAPAVLASPGRPAGGEGGRALAGCPYMGLAAFQAEDAEWFFGRERLVAELVTRLSEAPFLAVVGPSGSGKSSALRAGLLPAVRNGTVPGARSWKTVTFTPGERPLEELAAQVARVSGVAAGSLLADLLTAPENLRLAVRQALADRPSGARLLLVIDQFEEAFAPDADEGQRRGFIQALSSVSEDPHCRAKVVLGVRADFYGHCAEYFELVAAMQDRQVLVGPMNTAELHQAIQRPAAHAGLVLEQGLVETVLEDLGDEPGSLPLLSHALFATWQRRRGPMLTLADYRDAGGVRQAIAQTAGTVYGGFDAQQQVIAKDVFLRLTALGEGTEDTRRRVPRVELPAGPNVDAVLKRLAKERLVVLGEDTVEVAHEALIREWPTLRGWLTDDREGLRLHRRLTNAATEWDATERDPGALYRSGRLITAREWAKDNDSRLNDLECEFLAASEKQERDELAAVRKRRTRLLSVALVVVLAVAGWQAWIAQGQRNQAIAQRLNARATRTIDQHPLSLLLSLESLRTTPTDEASNTLLRGVLQPRHNSLEIAAHNRRVRTVAFSPNGEVIVSAGEDGTVRRWEAATGRSVGQPLTGHSDAVHAVAFTSDGIMITAIDEGGEVRVWDAATGAPVGQPLVGPSGSVFLNAAFNADGRVISLVRDDGVVRLWDMARSRSVGQPLVGHTGAVFKMAFSPDEAMIASVGEGGVVRLWDVTTGAPVGDPLTEHSSSVRAMAFSPDGKTVAATDVHGGVRIWEVPSGAPVGEPLTVHTGKVETVAFSPDGDTIASAGLDRTVRLWDVARSTPIGEPLTGHTGEVEAVTFSPDGTRIASVDGDGTVRVWDAATGRTVSRSLMGHTGEVEGVAFSPSGEMVASASSDGTVRLWDGATGAPVGEPLTGNTDWVNGVVFSPDGKMVASAGGDDGAVRLWDAATGAPIREPLTGHTGEVYDVAFSPDSATIVSASADGTVRRWHAATGAPIGEPLTGHTDGVRGLAFTPDGDTIVSLGFDQVVRLWDAATGQLIAERPTRHNGPLSGVAFSPDGRVIASASASYDGAVRLWDASTGAPVGQPLTGHTDGVNGVAFSSDGRVIASAGLDSTVRLWDAATGAAIGEPLTGHTDWVNGVAFSPDGKKVVSASDDGTVRLWPVTLDGWIEHACTLAERNLTRAEWDQYVGRDQPYVRTCPDLPSGLGAPPDAPAASYPGV